MELNREVIAKLNINDTQIELIETLKNGKEGKTMITCTGADLLENTATATSALDGKLEVLLLARLWLILTERNL